MCPVIYLLALAFADEAFEATELSPSGGPASRTHKRELPSATGPASPSSSRGAEGVAAEMEAMRP